MTLDEKMVNIKVLCIFEMNNSVFGNILILVHLLAQKKAGWYSQTLDQTVMETTIRVGLKLELWTWIRVLFLHEKSSHLLYMRGVTAD